MKKFFFTMFLAASSICMMGQTRVIKGYVVDKKTGNYLPGAEVTVKGGAESTTTDADGSFSLEVGLFAKNAIARYAGMADKKLKIGDHDLVFRMKKDKGFWFLNFVGGLIVGPKGGPHIDHYNYYDDYNNILGCFGLMGGYLDKWGFYGKFTINPWKEGQQGLAMGSFGVTKRILPWLHASLGIGVGRGQQNDYSFYSSFYESYTDGVKDSYGYNYFGGGNRAEAKIQVMPEIGLIFKLSKHLMANIHYGIGICTEKSNSYSDQVQPTNASTPNTSSTSVYYSNSCWYEKETTGLNHNLSIGIGYAF